MKDNYLWKESFSPGPKLIRLFSICSVSGGKRCRGRIEEESRSWQEEEEEEVNKDVKKWNHSEKQRSSAPRVQEHASSASSWVKTWFYIDDHHVGQLDKYYQDNEDHQDYDVDDDANHNGGQEKDD